jgi:C4-type Zn-finger protein
MKAIRHVYSPKDYPTTLIAKLRISPEKLRNLTSKLNYAVLKISKFQLNIQQPPSTTAFVNVIETVVTKFLEDREKEINKLKSELKDSRDCGTRRQERLKVAEAKAIEVTLRLDDLLLEKSNLRKETAEYKREKENLEKSLQERDRLLRVLREALYAKIPRWRQENKEKRGRGSTNPNAE